MHPTGAKPGVPLDSPGDYTLDYLSKRARSGFCELSLVPHEMNDSTRNRPVHIVEVRTRRERERFIACPERIHRDCPNWVAPMRFERREFLDERKNPFFEHADVRLFLALDDSGSVRGRVAGVVNRKHLEFYKDGVGFFGMFECEDDPAAAKLLLDAAASFLKDNGLTTMRGPANLSVNHEIGLLIEGFDRMPSIMMPYNPPYYIRLLEENGLKLTQRLFAYGFDRTDDWQMPERLTQGIELAKRRYKYTIRPVCMERLQEDIRKMHLIYSEAWEENWGAVPMTEKEFEHLGHAFKLIGDPDYCVIAELNGEPAGFALGLPNINQVLTRTRGSTPMPLRILSYLTNKGKIDSGRLMAMGVRKAHRNIGIDICLCYELIIRGIAKGYRHMEASWILETNIPMRRVMEKFGASVTKTYGMYERAL